MRDTGKNLDANRGKALLALLACDTVAAAAERAGRGQATLYRYLAESDFKAAYRAARAAVVGHAGSRLRRDCVTTGEMLRAVCDDGAAPASARGETAKAIVVAARPAGEVMRRAAIPLACEAARAYALNAAA